MGRWGLRRIATLCVLVWVVAACGSMLPALPLETPVATEPTLIIRTPASSPGAATHTAAAVSSPSAAAQTEASLPRSPRPDWTPIPIATPFYYTVAAGDTLSGIAERFSLPLEALRAANGDLPLTTLYPGQLLLIPLDLASAGTGTLVRFLPTSTPLPLRLSAPTCYVTPAAEALCLGYVRNPYPMPLTNLVVQVALLDDERQTLSQRAVSVPLQHLLPGQGTAYAARFPAAPDFVAPQASLLSAAPLPEDAFPIQPLVTLSAELTPEGSLIRVQGRFRASGASPVGEIVVVAVLLDDDDRVTGLKVERPVTLLTPGDELTLDLLIVPLAEGTARVELAGEGTIQHRP